MQATLGRYQRKALRDIWHIDSTTELSHGALVVLLRGASQARKRPPKPQTSNPTSAAIKARYASKNSRARLVDGCDFAAIRKCRRFHQFSNLFLSGPGSSISAAVGSSHETTSDLLKSCPS